MCDANQICQRFAEAFIEHRARLGVSKEELARECGFSVSVQGKWERGVCLPGLYCLVAMADYFGVSLDELVGRDGRN